MSRAFLNFYRTVRNRLEDPMNLDWIIHTSIGKLYMLRLEWNEEESVVMIHSHDENGAYRFVAFADAVLLSFPLEVTMKTEIKKTLIGFQSSGSGEDVTANN